MWNQKKKTLFLRKRIYTSALNKFKSQLSDHSEVPGITCVLILGDACYYIIYGYGKRNVTLRKSSSIKRDDVSGCELKI